MTEYLVQSLHCIEKFILYIIPCVVVLLTVHFMMNVPRFVFRKLLHFVAFSCVTLMILNAESWQAASLCSVIIAVVVYPLLALLEHKSWYSSLFVEKSVGEIKRSLLLLFFMFAVLNAISWGIFKRPDIGGASIVMWGFGDAAAALIGIPFGRHKIKSKKLPMLLNGSKSMEGCIANLVVSFIAGFCVFCFYSRCGMAGAAILALIGAAASALTELVSPSELDTVTTPMVILAVLLVGTLSFGC